MTAFTVTAARNIDELASKTGGDTYAVNGGTLTIDQDSRYGANQNTSASLGNITVSSSLGGLVSIDGRYVRLIPYSSGSGNVPAGGATVSQSATSGKLIGVWSAINAAPVAAGAAMPASGFIKVKQVSGTFASGALTGIGATATGADVAGWIEVVGDQSATMTLPRLGTLEIKGAWFEVGTTSGSAATTYQLPTSGQSQWFPGVFVETGVGTGDFEFYPCAGSLAVANAVGTDDGRGKLCWISTAGVLRFGSDGTNIVGYVPPSGRKVVLPNVILVNCATTARTANVVPNTTLSTRYDFTTTSGGAVSIDKAAMSWYPAFSKAATLTLSNTGINDQLSLNYLGDVATLTKVGIGATAAQNNLAFSATGCINGITMTDCVLLRYGAGYVASIQDSEAVAITRCKSIELTGWTSGYHSLHLNRVKNSSMDELLVGPGNIQLDACTNLTASNLTHMGRLGSGSTRGGTIVVTGSGCANVKVDGVFGIDADGYVTSPPIAVYGYGSDGVDISNVGSPSNPLNLASGLASFTTTYSKNLRVRRCYFNTNAGSSLLTVDSSNSFVTVENCYRVGGTSSADYVYNLPAQNMLVRGFRTSVQPANTPTPLSYGSHWHDFFISDTTGTLRLEFNEPSDFTSGLVTTTGNAKFTGTGYIAMPSIGDSVTVEMNYFALGHTGLAAVTPSLEYGTFAKYTWEYQINTGSGWSAWKDLTSTNLGAEAGISPTIGVKLKVRATTNTVNTDAIAALRISTTTTLTDQRTLYPLDGYALTLSGLPHEAEVRCYVGAKDGTATEIGGTETSGTTFTFTHYSAGQSGFIHVIHPDYKLKEFDYTYAASDREIPMQMDRDTWYSNP